VPLCFFTSKGIICPERDRRNILGQERGWLIGALAPTVRVGGKKGKGKTKLVKKKLTSVLGRRLAVKWDLRIEDKTRYVINGDQNRVVREGEWRETHKRSFSETLRAILLLGENWRRTGRDEKKITP